MFDDLDDALDSNIQPLMDIKVGGEGVEAGLGEAGYLVDDEDGLEEEWEDDGDEEEW